MKNKVMLASLVAMCRMARQSKLWFLYKKKMKKKNARFKKVCCFLYAIFNDDP